jgi:serine/threonine-protein kinase
MTQRFPQSTSQAHAPVSEVNGFEILEKIGKGAMGAVFKARQRSLDRIVALKILPPNIAANATFIERFQREARTSAKLCHPNIVQGIDVGQDPRSKLWYFAMEYVDGPSLRAVIRKRKVFEEHRALKIAHEVVCALEAIDRAGMIHRDIKPDNILLTSDGAVKVADLGLARFSGGDAEMTQMGQAVGTPHYMSPEQVRGDADVDIRADLYALGATLFHMVTGEAPFSGGSSIEIMTKHLHDPVPLANEINPKVSADCTKLIAKLMEKKREQREQTPQHLRKTIEALLARSSAPKHSSPATLAQRHTRHEQKSHVMHATPRAAPHHAEESKRANRMLVVAASVVIIIGVVMLFAVGKPAPPGNTDRAAPNKVEPLPKASAKPTVTTTAQGDDNPEGSRKNTPFDITGGEDIHESIARAKLDEIQRLATAGKLTSGQAQERYKDLAESSLHGTNAAREAMARLMTAAPASAPAAIPASKGVWWEGEDAIEHNFVSHVWLAEQLDKRNLSGTKYLNHMNDEKWIKLQGKTPPQELHASYSVDVPTDATYTLWVREYDPYSGVNWQFKWDDAKWYLVPPDYPFENKVEIGKDRWLVWRCYAGQKLTKGKHTFFLQATIEGRHQVAGFDCFYLTTEPFKPDGARKP